MFSSHKKFKSGLWLSLVITLSSTAQLSADTYEIERDTCGEYAAKAVYQFRSQQLANCGFKGLRWSEDGAGQHQWCRTVRPIEAERETQARALDLMKCLNSQGSINKNDLQVSASVLNGELISAAGRGATERMQQVIAAGADFSSRSAEMMASAINSQNTKTISFLRRIGIALHAPKQSPLEDLISYQTQDKNTLKTLTWLLQNGVDPDELGNSGYTPLWVAITRENPEAVSLLLRSGANPNINIHGGGCNTNMPMDSAIDTGNEKIIALLRQAGAKSQAQCSAT